MLYFRLRKVHRNDIFNFISESFAKISTGHTCGVTGVLKQESTKLFAAAVPMDAKNLQFNLIDRKITEGGGICPICPQCCCPCLNASLFFADLMLIRIRAYAN